MYSKIIFLNLKSVYNIKWKKGSNHHQKFLRKQMDSQWQTSTNKNFIYLQDMYNKKYQTEIKQLIS